MTIDYTKTNNEAFEKWFEDEEPLTYRSKERDRNLAKRAWQAALTYAEQQRQEQEPVAECIEVEYKVDSFSDGTRIDIEILPNAKLKNGDKLFITPPDQSKLIESQASEIAELKANRNVIRNALDNLVDYCIDNGIPCREALEALASTPAQSLAKHDDETIEKCAKVCDGVSLKGSNQAYLLAKDIRNLKVNHDNKN